MSIGPIDHVGDLPVILQGTLEAVRGLDPAEAPVQVFDLPGEYEGELLKFAPLSTYEGAAGPAVEFFYWEYVGECKTNETFQKVDFFWKYVGECKTNETFQKAKPRETFFWEYVGEGNTNETFQKTKTDK